MSSGTVRTLTGSSVSPPTVGLCGVGDAGRGGVCRPQSTPNGGGGVPVVRWTALNGGYGSVLFQVSFDSGAHWLTLYENGRAVDRLGGIVAIAEPGRDYEFRLTLTNDAQGRGAEVYKLLFCTDPSVWA